MGAGDRRDRLPVVAPMGAPRGLPSAVNGTVDRILTALAAPIPTTGTRGLELWVAIYRTIGYGFKDGRAYAVAAAAPAGVRRRGAGAVGHTSEAVLAVALTDTIAARAAAGETVLRAVHAVLAVDAFAVNDADADQVELAVDVIAIDQLVAILVDSVGAIGLDERRLAAIDRACARILARLAKHVATA